jgi:hypothetical protein
MSWDKLDQIQDWLLTPAAAQDPFWRIEGELLLADGRQSLAKVEPGRPGTGSRDERLRAAEGGFHRVVDDPQARPEQVRRARAGLDRMDRGRATNANAPILAGIEGRRVWRARQAVPREMTTNTRKYQWITVHHSAIEGAAKLDGSLDQTTAAIRQVQNAHMNTGYGDIGYHFLIGPGGRIFAGRELRYQGGHVRGDDGTNLNPGNIGICVLGNFEQDKPTQAAVLALGKLVLGLRRHYEIPAARVRAHMDWKTTACPGKNLLPYVERLK